TGAVRWQATTDGDTSPGPAVADGIVYVSTLGATSETLYAFDAATGTERWHVPFCVGCDLSTAVASAPPAVADGMVCVGGNDGAPYAFGAASGGHRWLAGARGSEAGVAVADGAVYTAGPDGGVSALDAATGHPRWQFRPGNGLFSAPVVVDGVVYA